MIHSLTPSRRRNPAFLSDFNFALFLTTSSSSKMENFNSHYVDAPFIVVTKAANSRPASHANHWDERVHMKDQLSGEAPSRSTSYALLTYFV